VLTNQNKPNPRGDDCESRTDDRLEETEDGLCPITLRADSATIIKTAVAIPALIVSGNRGP
jgi:hypothetical protein